MPLGSFTGNWYYPDANAPTGPIRKITQIPDSGPAIGDRFYWDQTFYRQKPPYRKRLPYSMERKVTTMEKNIGLEAHTLSTPATSSPVAQEALASAYKKFKDALGDNSQILANYAERKQAVSMIAKRAGQIALGARMIRRGQFVSAARVFGLSKKDIKSQGLRKSAKSAGSTFLEMHLGWEPMVKDIYNACDILQRPIPHLRVKGTGGSSRKPYTFFKSTGYPSATGSYHITYEETAYCQLLADFYVDNPNEWLANQLGLINPAAVLWELATLSFVVDWFVNVGDVLNSLTDFAGLKFIEPTTTFLTWRRRVEVTPTYGRETRGEAWRMNRQSGIATPGFMVRPFKGFSPIRGLTAVSLLVQQLKTLK